MNKKYIYITLLSGFLFILSSGFCLAFTINITDLPGLPANPELPDYIKVIFTFAMQIGGAIAVLALIIGAIRWLTSAGSPEKIGEAKKSIYAAAYGLVLLLSSVLILRTINPALENVELNVETLDSAPGLYILIGGGHRRSCPSQVNDINGLPEGAFGIFYECPTGSSPGSVTPYLISSWSGTDFRGGILPRKELNCGEAINFQGERSFTVRLKGPGVYLYTNGGCTSDNPYTTYTTQTIPDFDTTEPIQCIEVLNSPSQGVYYGAILHRAPLPFELGNVSYYGGKCASAGSGGLSVVMTTNGLKQTFNVTGNFRAVSVFRINHSWANAGDGVVLFSNPFFNERQVGGSYEIRNDEIGAGVNSEGFYKESARLIEFNYSPAVPQAEKDRCIIPGPGDRRPNFQKCPGSVQIKGDYLVVISSLGPGGGVDCQLFQRDRANNIEVEPIAVGLDGSKELQDIYIVPIGYPFGGGSSGGGGASGSW